MVVQELVEQQVPQGQVGLVEQQELQVRQGLVELQEHLVLQEQLELVVHQELVVLQELVDQLVLQVLVEVVDWLGHRETMVLIVVDGNIQELVQLPDRDSFRRLVLQYPLLITFIYTLMT